MNRLAHVNSPRRPWRLSIFGTNDCMKPSVRISVISALSLLSILLSTSSTAVSLLISKRGFSSSELENFFQLVLSHLKSITLHTRKRILHETVSTCIGKSELFLKRDVYHNPLTIYKGAKFRNRDFYWIFWGEREWRDGNRRPLHAVVVNMITSCGTILWLWKIFSSLDL